MIKKKNTIRYNSLTVENVKYRTLLTKKYKQRKPYEEIDFRKVKAFISGNINKIFVKKDQQIKAGDELLILEAMKMRNKIVAEQDGQIKEIYVKTGENVIKNQLLIEFK